MYGQINDTAQLHGNGRTLLVTGWIRFDGNEVSAVLTVTVTQDKSTVEGRTRITAKKKAWTVELDGRDNFLPGPAHAEVRAKVNLANGTQEEYPEPGDEPWERFITLVG